MFISIAFLRRNCTYYFYDMYDFLALDAVDHLVNNAGIVGVSAVEDAEDITRMRPVMVTSVLCIQKLDPSQFL